jgi:HEPN domain-containing protein
MSEELKEWISKAEGDYFSALREYRARKHVNHDSTCFHAQSSASRST